jgi:hypothetical protein
METVAKFRYLGTIVTNPNYINEEIQRRLNTGIFVTIQLRMPCLPVSTAKT